MVDESKFIVMMQVQDGVCALSLKCMQWPFNVKIYG